MLWKEAKVLVQMLSPYQAMKKYLLQAIQFLLLMTVDQNVAFLNAASEAIRVECITADSSMGSTFPNTVLALPETYKQWSQFMHINIIQRVEHNKICKKKASMISSTESPRLLS